MPQNALTLNDGIQSRLSVSFAGRERERGQASHAKTLSRRRRLREGGGGRSHCRLNARPPLRQWESLGVGTANGGASFAFSVHSSCLQGKTSGPLAGSGLVEKFACYLGFRSPNPYQTRVSTTLIHLANEFF